MTFLNKFAALSLVALAVTACSSSDDADKKASPKDVKTSEAACDAFLKSIESKDVCESKVLTFNAQPATVVATASAHGIVFADGKIETIATPFFMKPYDAVKAYVASTGGPEITEELFAEATQDIRQAKRGFLLGVHFTGEDAKGDIYITPKGRLTGRVE